MRDIHLLLKPSRQFLGLMFTAGIGSLWVLIMLPISIIYKLLLIVGSAIYLAKIIYRHGLLRSPHAFHELTRLSQNKWLITFRNGSISPATLKNEYTVTRFVCVLRYQLSGEKRSHSCVIFRDGLVGDQTYRRLLMHLAL